MLDCIDQQIDYQLTDTVTVSVAGKVTIKADVDVCMGKGSADLVTRIAANTPCVLRRNAYWQGVTQPNAGKVQQVIDHPSHAGGAALDVHDRLQAGCR